MFTIFHGIPIEESKLYTFRSPKCRLLWLVGTKEIINAFLRVTSRRWSPSIDVTYSYSPQQTVVSETSRTPRMWFHKDFGRQALTRLWGLSHWNEDCFHTTRASLLLLAQLAFSSQVYLSIHLGQGSEIQSPERYPVFSLVWFSVVSATSWMVTRWNPACSCRNMEDWFAFYFAICVPCVKTFPVNKGFHRFSVFNTLYTPRLSIRWITV